MTIKNRSFSLPTIFILIITLHLSLFYLSYSDVVLRPTSYVDGGQWEQLQQSIGVSAMHMQVLPDNRVIMFDRTDFGPSNLSLPNGKCRVDSRDMALKLDCTAHSVLYDIARNQLRPLMVQTDTWCSSGALDQDGTLIQTGGYNDGDRKVRTFTPCGDDDTCEWRELDAGLFERRWYASNHILPDGRVIIVGGRNVFSYEFFPKTSPNEKSFFLPFLKETRDRNEENNLYPFLHLLPDGNLFMFANQRSILFDYKANRVIREYPVIPGPFKRNYPSTGSSVLLPLWLNGPGLPAAEVMICGGALPGAFTLSDKKKVFIAASSTCGRIRVTDPDPKWVMETMPTPHVMPDMLLLPTGDVILLNGGTNGTAGWEDGRNAILNPVVYRPSEPDPTRRFLVMNPAETPRMYHSAAVVLPDGRVLVGGSNPHVRYNFTADFYPTELSLDAYYPPYLGLRHALLRPSILSVDPAGQTVVYGQQFSVNFQLTLLRPRMGLFVGLLAPSFTTHSYAMNQRLMFLNVVNMEVLSPFDYMVTVVAPSSPTVAPPGYFMLFVVHDGIPSVGAWLKVRSNGATM